MAKQEFVFDNPPIYDAAGILNLHAGFKDYPPKYYYHHLPKADEPLDEASIYQFACQLSEGQRLYLRDRKIGENLYLPDYQPIKKDGFLSEISDLAIFQRLWGIYQLGLHRTYPVLNTHTRAEHSFMVTIQAVGTLQSMFDHNPNRVLEKLRKDLGEDHTPSDEALIEKSVKLLCLSAMMHDAGTVAGGDTFKYLLKVLSMPHAEEELLEEIVFEKENKLSAHFSGQRDQLNQFIGDHDLDKNDMEFVVSCIQGKSKTLIGELINSPTADVLEPDRIAYTLQDFWAMGLFRRDLPDVKGRPLPVMANPQSQIALYNDSRRIEEILRTPNLAGAEPYYLVFPWNALDPSGDVLLDRKDRAVYTDPHKMVALAYLRTVGTIHHYAGFKMLGLEKELQDELEGWVKTHGLPDCLSLEQLLSSGNKELTEGLRGLEGNKKIQEILANLENFGSNRKFRGIYDDADDENVSLGKFSIKIKPGLETLVKNPEDDRVISLGDFAKRKYTNPLAGMMLMDLKAYSGKTLSVYPFDEKPAVIVLEP